MQSEAAAEQQAEKRDECISKQGNITKKQEAATTDQAANKEQEKISFETQCQEEVVNFDRGVHFAGKDVHSDADNLLFGQTSVSQPQNAGEEIDAKVKPNSDNHGNHSTGLMVDEIIIEDTENEQGMEKETAEEASGIPTEEGLPEKNDHESVLEEKVTLISELKAENARLQKVNEDAAELVNELELDRLSSEVSYLALLQGLKDNLELKLIDRQKEVQELELEVKEEKTLREEEQAKVEALEAELQKIQLAAKALTDSQNTEIERLRETIADIELRSKVEDDSLEESKQMKTALKVCSAEMQTGMNAVDNHDNEFPKENLAQFSDKFDSETSLQRDEPTCHGDKLGQEEQNRRGLEEGNADLETQLQEQEDMISERQEKKRRRKGWKKLIFCS